MKKINLPLILGVLLVIAVLLISMYPEYFSPVDPYGKQRLEFEMENGKTSVMSPPVPPCEEYPWGTDHKGRDMRALIMYGCKKTMVLVLWTALLRLLIALPIAILGAYGSKISRGLIKTFNILFSSFPMIIAVVILSRIYVFYQWFHEKNTIIGFLLVFMGWSKLANHIMKRVEEVLNLDFIEGEIAIGKNKLEIAFQNIIPHIIPSIIVMFFMEVAMIMLSLIQIGILDSVAMGSYVDRDGMISVPIEFDWASLLIYSHYLFSTGKYWIIVYPALAFAITIMGFNLLGEGLRIEFEKRDSRVITLIRKIPSFLSPIRLVYEIKNFVNHKKTLYTKLALCLLVLLIMFFPQPKGKYRFDMENAKNMVSELNSVQCIDVEDKSNQYNYNPNQVQYIVNKLQEYGVQPYFEEFIQPYKVDTSTYDVLNIKIQIGDENTDIEIKNKYDYIFMQLIYINQSLEARVFEENSLTTLTKEEMSNKVLLVDTRNKDLNSKNIFSAIRTLEPKALVYIVDWLDGKTQMNGFESRRGDTLEMYISAEIGDKLLAMNKPTIQFDISPKEFESDEDINIIGYIPGSDEKLKNELIIIGSGINLMEGIVTGSNSEELAIQLQLAEVFTQKSLKPKRTVIFAFWGGMAKGDRGSKELIRKLRGDLDKRTYYIDLRNIAGDQVNEILVDTYRIMPKDEMGQGIIKSLKKMARRNEIELKYGNIQSDFANDFYYSNRASIVMDTSNDKIGMNFSKLVKKNTKVDMSKIGQMLLDMVVEISGME